MASLPDNSPLHAPDVRAALFGGALSLGLLVGAWIFQYGFGYAPCIMCYWQRYAHMGVIGIAVAIIAFRALFGPRFLPSGFSLALLILALLLSAGLASYHVGVEFGVLEGPKQCAAGTPGGTTAYNLEDPLAVLDQPIAGPSCSDVTWRFLGLSMAAWNALLSLAGALGVAKLGLVRKTKRYETQTAT